MSRVLVLGAGIAGVATAWYLAAGGAEVTVIDRGTEPASETSHANGCHISTQSAGPWMGPAGVREFLATRLSSEQSVRVLRAHDPGRWRWFAAALSASLPGRYEQARSVIVRLAQFSRERLEALTADLALDVAFDAGGALAVYRTERAFARARRRSGAEALDTAAALALEPALENAAVRPVGALFYPGDATADCRRFCIALATHAARTGVKFRYATQVNGLVVRDGCCRGAETDAGPVAADHCVVALGAGAAPLLRCHGLRLPILPLRGYTLSAPIVPAVPAPGRLVDAERRIVCARLGGVFRAAGMADFAGEDTAVPQARVERLVRIAADWYPALARGETKIWSCLRPMTPDGPPALGASPIPGLWLNAGLGPLGWTLGCGAGRIVADLVLGREPPIPLAGLEARRFA